jgi:ferredoxin/flavodoxin---NADP+ reductase
MNSWNEVTYKVQPVILNVEIAKGAYILFFERSFNFRAGQVVAIGVDKQIAPRLYSIASGENDDLVEILYTEKVNGELTPMLSLLSKGAKIMISEPFGTFTQADDNDIYVAAGTGIAPFISRIRSNKTENPIVIHGASYPEFFYYDDFLKDKLGRNYIQCCSRCQTDDTFQGRVTDFLKQWKNMDTSKKYYLCGSAEMVVETRDLLLSRGVPFANINAEIYF